MESGNAETAVAVAFVVGECLKNDLLSRIVVKIEDGEDKSLDIIQKVIE